eukprot:4987818-Pyramimonas_sp.AAC.1
MEEPASIQGPRAAIASVPAPPWLDYPEADLADSGLPARACQPQSQPAKGQPVPSWPACQQMQAQPLCHRIGALSLAALDLSC